MPSIYDIDYDSVDLQLLPPDKRLPKMIAWVQSLTTPLQWLRDLFYNEYANGFTGPAWDVLATYAKGDRVRYIDRAVYECVVPTTAGILPTDTAYWIKIQDIYIGINERAKYNSQKMVFEFLLNKWFEVAPLPADQIVIQNNHVDTNGFFMSTSDDVFGCGQMGTQQNQAQFMGVASSPYGLSQYDFTIKVPSAVYAGSLINSEDKIIRAIADKYVIAGMSYNIITY